MKLRLIVSLAFLLCFPALLLAVDIDDDGLHELFFWSGSEVSVHAPNGQLLDRIPIPQGAIEEPPILFHGRSGNTPIVFTLRIDKNNNGELIAFSSAGTEQTISLGKLKKTTIVVENFDGDPSSDVLYSDQSGNIKVVSNPLSGTLSAQSIGVRIKKKERFTLIGGGSGPSIARYGTGKKKTRRVTVHERSGERAKLSTRIPKGGLLFPLYDGAGISPQFFGAEKSSKQGAKITTHFYDISTRAKQKVTGSTPLSPGYFVDMGTPQFAKSSGLNVQFFSVANPTIPLQEVNLDFGGGPIPTDPGSGGGGLPSSENCDNTFPQAQLNQAAAAFRDGNFTGFQVIISQVTSQNYCANILQQIGTFLEQQLFTLSRSALLPKSFTLLGSPIFSVGNSSGKKNSSECDKLRSGDGPGGWILKASDHGGTLVTLSPGNFGSTKAELITPNGKLLEKLKYTGVSNFDHTGARGTFRGSKPPSSYPRALIVKFYVNQGYGGEQAWCFETKNSHVRND